MMPTKEDEEKEVQDFGIECDSLDPIARNLSPKDRLQFAKWVLKGIFIFFIISVSAWLYQEARGETLLDIFKTGLLPIAAFVIGDYFGSRGK